MSSSMWFALSLKPIGIPTLTSRTRSPNALKSATVCMSVNVGGEIAAWPWDGVVTFVIHPGWVQTDMGGPNAKITTQQCVEGMLSVIDQATPEHNGRFMNWDGTELPW